jgi:hypothetical protein
MRSPVVAFSFGILLAAAIGCAIGTEQEPGCQADADCPGGWTCRAGACFATTTGRTDPVEDGGDSGDVGDGGGEDGGG